MRLDHRTRIFLCHLAAAAAVFLFVRAAMDTRWPAALERGFRSAVFASRLAGPGDYRIVIVAIDERSFAAFKKDPALAEFDGFNWPWPPSMHAVLLDRLAAAGADRVGFDILLSESFERAYLPEYASPSSFTVVRKKRDIPVVLAAKEESGVVLMPLDAYRKAGFGFGLANIPLSGGVEAWHYNFLQNGLESFALAIARCEGGDFDLKKLGWEDRELGMEAFISYRGRRGESFPVISFSDVLKGAVPSHISKKWGRGTLAALVNGKTVLVGRTSLDAHDIFKTPAGSMPGVEIHAHALSMLHEKHSLAIREFGRTGRFLTIAAALLFGLLLVCVSNGAALVAAALAAGAGYLFAAAIAIAWYSLFIPMTETLSAFYLFIALSSVLSASIERRAKLFLQGAFGKYVSPRVAESLMEDPGRVKLGGERREITVMFTDIVDFTSLSEKMVTVELIKLLNEYLHLMSGEVLGRDGTLDKYIGDAIMAFWGAPVETVNHREMACIAALEMRKKLSAFNAARAALSLAQVDCRIGINTGEAVVGNAGSEERFDYTAVGDTVNTASRLESLNKMYGTSVIISGSTLAGIEGLFDTRMIDRVVVKGRTAVTDIYELAGYAGTSDAEFLREHANAMKLYFERKWSEAADLFEKLSAGKGDRHSSLFAERCRRFASDPALAEKFDGAWVLHRK